MKTSKVIKSGVLEIFNDLPCYVLSDGQRVFRLSNLTKALRDKEHGKFGNYLAASNIVKYLPERLRPLTDETMIELLKELWSLNLMVKLKKVIIQKILWMFVVHL